MEENSLEERELKFPERAYELLSWITRGRDITVRDDQYYFPWLLDIAKSCQKKRCRFRLIDSGKLETFQLESLGKTGADLYTSDEARPNVVELEFMNKACHRGGAMVAYFHHGPLEEGEKEEEKEKEEEEKKEEDLGRISFSDLEKIGRSGIYLHLSNREGKRNFSQLNELAYACRRGGSWLVYYHHGALELSLGELGRNSAWIHVSDGSVRDTQDVTLLIEILKTSLSKRANIVLHLEREWKAYELRDVIKAGAIILFKSSLKDYKSPLKPLEKAAGRRRLDSRAYYLYPFFLL